jgi:hypothetical protein
MNTDSPRDDANNEIPPSCYFGSAQPSPTITISSTQTRGAYSQTYELQRRKNTQSSAFDFTVLQ